MGERLTGEHEQRAYDCARMAACGEDTHTKEGVPVNVGNKLKLGEHYIFTISDAKGNPIETNELDRQVQRAVGKLIDEAGQLPIYVTPMQIFRAFPGNSTNTTVTQWVAALIQDTMDKLMYTFGQIKGRPDNDYQSQEAGYLQEQLIMAEKLVLQARDGTWTTKYGIYDYPMYYRYSRVTVRVACCREQYMLGDDQSFVKTARSVVVKANLLAKVKRMQECKKNKKSFVPLIRITDFAFECLIELTPRTLRTLRKNIGIYLDELRKQGQIKEATETKERRQIVGFTVTL